MVEGEITGNWSKGIQPGDVVLIEGIGLLADLIRKATAVPFSHAVPVVKVDTDDHGREIAYVYQTGAFSFITRLATFAHESFTVYRPQRPVMVTKDGEEVVIVNRELSAREGEIAADFLLKNTVTLAPRYPWWELVGYLVKGSVGNALIRASARGVCSVMTSRLLEVAGVIIQRNGVVLSPDLVVPGDLAKQGWRVVAHNDKPAGEKA